MRFFKRDPGIVRDLASWASTNGLEISEVFLEAKSYTRKMPICLYRQEAAEAYFSGKLTYNSNERFLLKIPHAEVIGDRGFVRLPDGQFVYEFVSGNENYIRENPAYYQRLRLGSRWNRRNLKGCYYSLGGSFARTYYHWMTDVLFQFHLTLEALPGEVKFILPGPLCDWQWHTLSAIGVERSRIVEHAPNESLNVECLYFIPAFASSGRDHPEPCNWLRKQLYSYFGLDGRSGLKGQKIYISRAKAKFRRILNEDALMPLLEEHGFTRVFMENYSLKEQWQIAYSADTILGPHGAGLVNVLASRPGTEVIEFFPPGSFNVHYWSLAEALELSYKCCEGMGSITGKDADYTVNPDHLAALIQG
jgi:capsular polysaccharide biosynthesis protein